MTKDRKRFSTGTAVTAGVLALGLGGAGVAFAAGQDVEAGHEPAPPYCASGDLALGVDGPKPTTPGGGQYSLDLTFTNTSDRTCVLDGTPGATLVGQDHPTFGPEYRLPAGAQPTEVAFIEPGGTATTSQIVVLEAAPGDEGWTPEYVHVTPNGSDDPLITEWTFDLSVVRQDGATRPGSYVQGLVE